MKFYLSGKVASKKWDFVNPFLHLCEFSASDGDYPTHGPFGWKGDFIVGPERWDLCNSEKHLVKQRVLDEIHDCDGLIAYLYSKDAYGSIAEIAYASAIGKACHLVIEESNAIEDPGEECPLQDAYWLVGSFPSVRVHRVVSSQEASRCLVEILCGFGISAASFVYFIEAIGQNEIKIGSSASPTRRLLELQTGNGSELRLLGVARGDKEFEFALHEKFGHLRLSSGSEWFRGTDELRRYIAAICVAK